MKKTLFCIVILFLTNCIVSAQKKPILPSGYFNNFNYSISNGFDYKDSLQVINEVYKVAAEIKKWNDSAQINYAFSDNNARHSFLDRTITVNALLGSHQQVVDAITTCRQIKKNAAYEAPYRLTPLAYSKACVEYAEDDSEKFKNVFSNKLSEQYSLVDSDFRNDIVNRQKGSAGLELRYWNNLKKLFQYAVTKSNGKINYNTAQHDIVPAYYAFNQLRKYQSLIDSVLYSLSPSVIQSKKEKITMRDGVKIQAVIYTDKANKVPLPAIISMNPYASGGADSYKGNIFAGNGYVYVYADARGRGESEGIFTPFENDAADFYDIIDWVSKQPWCNGKVATTGASYIGFAQWQNIRSQYKHPALKAINPLVSVGFGVDFPKENNIFYSFILPWAIYVSGQQDNFALYNDSKFWREKNYEHYKKQLPFSKLDSVAGMPNAFFQKWISHPDFDNYWKNILPSPADYKAINIAILSITGYYDGDQVGAMYYFNQHRRYGTSCSQKNHYLLIGPYDHGGAQWLPDDVQGGVEIETNAKIPIYKNIIWWFDWVLKGMKKPSFIKNNITYFEAGNNIWKGTNSFKELTNDSLELYFTKETTANPKRKDVYVLNTKNNNSNQTLKYSHNISAVLDSSNLYAKTNNDSIYMSSSSNMVFESLPLTKDLIISDKIISRIYASLNVPDADFEVSVIEIKENGEQHNLASGKIRVRYRNSAQRPQPAIPGEIMLLNFEDVRIYIKKVKKGSKIRLIFQSVNNPSTEKNWGFGGEVSKESTTQPRIIEAIIHTGGKYKSKIVIPYK